MKSNYISYLIIFFLIIFLAISIGFVYYRYNPAESSYFLKCPFKTVTGWDCPGCGSQRAFHELLHLNFKEAWHYNPLFVLLIPYAVLGILFNLESVKKRFPKLRKILFGKEVAYVLLIIVLAFFVFRNL